MSILVQKIFTSMYNLLIMCISHWCSEDPCAMGGTYINDACVCVSIMEIGSRGCDSQVV